VEQEAFVTGQTRRRRFSAAVLTGVCVLAAAKVLSLNPALHHRPDVLGAFDVIKTWKSDLAGRDTRFAAGDLDAAEERFRPELNRAPDDGSRCLVRVNLALTQATQVAAQLLPAPPRGIASDQPNRPPSNKPSQDDLDAITRIPQQQATERSAQAGRGDLAGHDYESSTTPW
jgi:hypothetical protein